MENLPTILAIIKLITVVFASIGLVLVIVILWEMFRCWKEPDIDIKMPPLDTQSHKYLRHRIQQILDDIDKEGIG